MTKNNNSGKFVRPVFSKGIVFRVDGSRQLGMGHIMRCIGFAQQFEKAGLKPVFLVRNHGQNIIEIIRNNDYHVETIPKCCSFRKDAAMTLGFASRHNADVIVMDTSNAATLANLNKYEKYLKTLKSGIGFLISIDGLDEDCVDAKISVASDMIVIPYVGAEDRKYKPCNNTRYLLGPDYFVFRQEFMETAEIRRSIRSKARNVLISVGGSDVSNLTVKIVRALIKSNNVRLSLCFVVGPGFSSFARQQLNRVLRDFSGKCKVIAKNENMAELMFWADLIITGSGLTKYEAAVIGTPAVVISGGSSQQALMDEFEEYGSALHLGREKNIRGKDIGTVVEDILDSRSIRSRMSKKGRGLVDAKGAERIISQIPKEFL